jgi:acetyl esterase/lipase
MTRSTHSYGDHPSQVGELFLPAGSGPFPVAAVFHGGYWKAMYDRSLMTDLCIDLAAHGLAAWNVEYRRVGNGGGWPGTFLDVAACVDLLADLDAPLDLARVVSVGHSAGGQLAFWAAGRSALPADAPGVEPRVRIRAAASQAGVLDLALAASLMPSSTPTRALLGDPVKDYERYVLASPRERLPLGISQLVLHGDRDDTVSLRIATSYASAARAVGDPCELVVLTHTGHYEHIDAGTEAWHVARDWLVAQASAVRS